jgi:putative oxidoreductase
MRMALFLTRVSIFVVFLVWSLDKFLNPSHASKVFQHFYFSPAFGPGVSYAIGALQLAISVGFLLGIRKKLTYGAVLLMHFISTSASYQIYLKPFAMPNMLFFAAFPMLAACYVLFILRDQDTLLSL